MTQFGLLEKSKFSRILQMLLILFLANGSSCNRSNHIKNKTMGGFVELKTPFTNFTSLYYKHNFVKFRVIPYQRNVDDNVRLFCYALDTNSDGTTDDTNSRIGYFFISEDGKGEDPGTLPTSSIKHGLSLSFKQMDDIFKMDPASCRYLILKPVSQTTGGVGAYGSYHLYKDGKDTKIVLNPSPPSL